jgi:hypothetical protein
MRRLIGAFWLIALVAGAGAAEAAGFDAAKIADLTKATGAFVALGKDAYQTGKPPRQTDPKVKQLLDTILDTSALSDPSLSFAQFLDVNNWLLDVVKVGLVYVTAGTGLADFLNTPTVTSEQQAQMNANVIAFAPEMGRYYDAQLAVSKAEIDLVVAELAAHPDPYKSGTKAQGVAEMRAGLTQTISGVLETFQLPGIDPGWLEDRIPALRALTPSAAKFLDPDQKRQLHDLAVKVGAASSDDAIKTGMNAVAQAIAP